MRPSVTNCRKEQGGNAFTSSHDHQIPCQSCPLSFWDSPSSPHSGREARTAGYQRVGAAPSPLRDAICPPFCNPLCSSMFCGNRQFKAAAWRMQWRIKQALPLGCRLTVPESQLSCKLPNGLGFAMSSSSPVHNLDNVQQEPCNQVWAGVEAQHWHLSTTLLMGDVIVPSMLTVSDLIYIEIETRHNEETWPTYSASIMPLGHFFVPRRPGSLVKSIFGQVT